MPALKQTSLMRDDEAEALMVKQEIAWDEMVLDSNESKNRNTEARIVRRKGGGNFF